MAGVVVLILSAGALLCGCSPPPAAGPASGGANGPSADAALPLLPDQTEPDVDEDHPAEEDTEESREDRRLLRQLLAEELARTGEGRSGGDSDAAPDGADEPRGDGEAEARGSAQESAGPAAGEPRPDSPELPEEDHSWRYEFRDDHDPDGIGKFYMGREIAWVMGYAAAPWLERPEREKEEATSRMIKGLGLKPGMVVADIGAGSGVLTLPIAGRVGPSGKVIAVDVQQEMLDLLAGKLRARQIRNVELVLGTEKSPRLPAESVDLALMVDVYHEFAYPYEMMLEISKAMKPGGRVVFVEFRMEDPQVLIKLVHKMTESQVKKEISLPEFQLKWKETIGTLPWQHVIVFEKLGAEQRPATADSPTEE